LIGQYAHGNEPSHHILYLYNYTDNPSKTQYYANKVMNEFYKNEPDGLIGNEDCGQMSAWYVLSALGFYPVTPGNNKYMIGSPQFKGVEINLENGKSFNIKAPKANNKNFYIKSAFLNTSKLHKSTSWNYPYLNHFDIINGGSINYIMTNKPKSCFNLPIGDTDLSQIKGAEIVLNPIITADGLSFNDKKLITISSEQKNVKIYYAGNKKSSFEKMTLYEGPFYIDSDAVIKAVAVNQNNQRSFESYASFVKKNNDWSVKLNSLYEPQYDGGGADGLIDEIHGNLNWRRGYWQGYQHTNFDAIIDLKKQTDLSNVYVEFLQDTRAWIIMPKKVSIYLSDDAIQFDKVYEGENFLPIEQLSPTMKTVEAHFPNKKSRYVRIVAEQYGKLPSWHEGAGGDSHIFVDEVLIN
jgi:hypothetical protein